MNQHKFKTNSLPITIIRVFDQVKFERGRPVFARVLALISPLKDVCDCKVNGLSNGNTVAPLVIDLLRDNLRGW